MTANTRSIDIKGVVSNKTRIRSKFFASTPSSDDDSSDENTKTLLTGSKKKSDKDKKDSPLNTKGFPQTPGSLDNFTFNDGVFVFEKDAELDGSSHF